jgi:hypothetical protein
MLQQKVVKSGAVEPLRRQAPRPVLRGFDVLDVLLQPVSYTARRLISEPFNR